MCGMPVVVLNSSLVYCCSLLRSKFDGKSAHINFHLSCPRVHLREQLILHKPARAQESATYRSTAANGSCVSQSKPWVRKTKLGVLRALKNRALLLNMEIHVCVYVYTNYTRKLVTSHTHTRSNTQTRSALGARLAEATITMNQAHGAHTHTARRRFVHRASAIQNVFMALNFRCS